MSKILYLSSIRGNHIIQGSGRCEQTLWYVYTAPRPRPRQRQSSRQETDAIGYSTQFHRSRSQFGQCKHTFILYTNLRKRSFRWQQYILRFKVTVDNALGMKMLQGNQNLQRERTESLSIVTQHCRKNTIDRDFCVAISQDRNSTTYACKIVFKRAYNDRVNSKPNRPCTWQKNDSCVDRDFYSFILVLQISYRQINYIKLLCKYKIQSVRYETLEW